MAYSLGIVAGAYCWRPILWWAVAGAAFVASAAYFARRRSGLGWFLALAAVFIAEAFRFQANRALTRLDTDIQSFLDRQELQITAHNTSDGRVQPAGFNEIRETIDVETEALQTPAGQSEPIHSGIRLSIYSGHPKVAAQNSDATIPSNVLVPDSLYHYGDRVRFPRS